MPAKYYTHFVTANQPALAAVESPPAEQAEQAEPSEWSGVVELRHPLEQTAGTRELRSLIAQSFDLTTDDIRILHWARLH
jgi:hypothetical protein